MSEITRKELEAHVRRCDNRAAVICGSRDASIKNGVNTAGTWGVTDALLTAEQARRDLALYDEMHGTKPTTPKRVRNEAACCGNCPYSQPLVRNKIVCRFEHPNAEHGSPVLNEIEWCGRHPDFWREA